MMKKSLKRKIIIALICSIMTLLTPMAALATNSTEFQQQREAEIMSRWTCIVDTMTDLKISGGVATVDCWVKGDVSTATKAKVIAELQVKSGNSWIAYGTWTNTQNDFDAYVYQTKSVKAGNTYRVKATYTVWEGSQSEQTIVFTNEVTA